MGEDLRGEVLDCGDAGHLAGGLDHHDEDGAAQVGPAFEEVEVGLGFLGVFFGDLNLDKVVLGNDVGVIDVAVSVKFGECLQTFLPFVVIAKPAWGLGKEEDEAGKEDCWDDLDSKWNSPFAAVSCSIPCYVASVAGPCCEDLTCGIEELL